MGFFFKQKTEDEMRMREWSSDVCSSDREVTSLDTGRRIVVRVNDRGPFAGRGRIIDLSKGAAEELGIRAQGHAAVRVRRIEPSEKDRARLRKGKPARALAPLSPRELQGLRSRLASGG